MGVVRVDANREILRHAIEQIPPDGLGDRMAANLRSWLAWERKPTLRQLEELSRKSSVPLGYFFLDSLPDYVPELLKGRLENSSPELVDTVHYMVQVQDWMEEYRRENAFGKISVIGSMGGKDIRKAEEAMLAELGLQDGWRNGCKSPAKAFETVRGRLNGYGITVMAGGIVERNTHRRLDINEFRAFAITDGMAHVIFVNSNDSPEAMLCALLHAAACVWQGMDELYQYAERQEGGHCRRVERIDRMFVQCLCDSVQSLTTSYTEAFRLTCTNAKTFGKYEELYGNT